jgi:hypothetical protein
MISILNRLKARKSDRIGIVNTTEPLPDYLLAEYGPRLKLLIEVDGVQKEVFMVMDEKGYLTYKEPDGKPIKVLEFLR